MAKLWLIPPGNCRGQVDSPVSTARAQDGLWHRCGPSKILGCPELCGGSNASREHAMYVVSPACSLARSWAPLRLVRFEFLGESVVTSLDSFKSRNTLNVGGKTYDYFSLEGGREERPRRHLAAALLAEGAAGEPAALRGRRARSPSDDIQAIGAWLENAQLRPRDRLPPGARADAGFHRRARRGRSRRDARRDGEARRRSEEDQPAGRRSISSSTTR